jgi:hypothetical protein
VGGSLVLQNGEIGVNITDNRFKIGDGETTWNNLEYHYPDDLNEAKYAQLSGGNSFSGNQIVTGGLTVSGSVFGGSATISGNISSSQINVNNNKIIGLKDPENQQDAANKKYVDEVAQGLSVKPAVHAATTVNLSATYTNGTAGVGAQLNLGPLATLDIDGEDTWERFDGILIKDQTNGFENGRYYVDQVGSVSMDWILTRCGYCDTADEIASAYVYVQGGDTFASTGWVANVGDLETFTVGTDAIDWIQFSGAGTYLAGNGLAISGNEFSAVGVADRISVSASGIDIDSNYRGQTSIDTLGDIEIGTWLADTISIEHGGTGATSASDARTNLELGNSATLNIGTSAGTLSEGNHLHDDRYYTETEVDALLNAKASIGSSSNVDFGIITANNYDVGVMSEASDTIVLNFSGDTGLHTRNATNNLNISGSNYRAGSTKTLVVRAGASNRTLTFDSNWIFLGTKPSAILANKTAVLTVTSLGANSNNCIAGWVSQE